MNQNSGEKPAADQPRFTSTQGQYLAFIDAYSRVHGYPPAEAELRRHFQVTPPSVHQMILTLERLGFIRRTPRTARSIEVLVPPELLPVLQREPVKSSVQRY
jgi:DNA-binding MarR family transcriptional regulator